MQLIEGPYGLHQASKRKLAAKIARRCHNRRKDPRRLSVAGGEVSQPLLPAHDIPPVRDHCLEPFAKAAQFVGLAAVKRHSLGVLAEAD